MALEKLDAPLGKWLIPLTRSLSWVDPNTITWLSGGIGIGSAVLLWRAGRDLSGAFLLLLAALGIVLCFVLDILDGCVARMHGRTSNWGDFLDHTLDRIIDTALLLAITHNSAWCPDPRWGWWTILSTLLASYLGTQAKSSGLPRDLSGFGRNDRLATVLLGTLAAAVTAFVNGHDPTLGGLSPEAPATWNGLSTALAICCVGGVWTFIVRFRNSRRELSPPPV